MQPFLPYLTRMITNFFFQKKDGKEQRLVGHLLLLLAAEVDVVHMPKQVAKYWRGRTMLPPSGESDDDLLCCYC